MFINVTKNVHQQSMNSKSPPRDSSWHTLQIHCNGGGSHSEKEVNFECSKIRVRKIYQCMNKLNKCKKKKDEKNQSECPLQLRARHELQDL